MCGQPNAMTSAKLWATVRRLTGLCFLFFITHLAAQSLDETKAKFLKGEYEQVSAIAATNSVSNRRNEEWRTLLVESLLTLGRYEEAHTNAVRAVQDMPFSVRLRLLLRETSYFQNDLRGVTNRMEELSNLLGARMRYYSDADSISAVGDGLLLLGVEPRLVLDNFYKRGRQMKPTSRYAFLSSGNLAMRKHDFAMAADMFRAGLKEFPEDSDLLAGLAESFQPGDREEMLKNLELALEINPNHIPSLLLVADHLIDAEEYEEAEKQLAAVLKINRYQPDALAYRAVLAHLRYDFVKEEEFRKAALAHWKSNPKVDHIIGLKLSLKYRFSEGAEAQRRALAFDENYLPAKRQLAQDLLRLGETKEGWEMVQQVHQQDGYDITAFNLTTLRDEMAKFQTLSNEFFIVRMSAHEAELYGDRVMALLTRAKETLCAKYELELERPTTVEIFPNQKDFAVRTFGMPGNPGYLGVCFGSVITANSPASQAANPSNWEAVLWHEFCHVVTLNATRNRMPRWLSEGISVYEELQANPTWGQSMNLAYRELILDGKLTPVGELTSAFMAPETPMHLQFAYYQSSLVVEYIIEKHGLNSLKAILRDLREGKSINDAIAARTAPLKDVETGFATFAKEKAEKLAPGVDLAKPPKRDGSFAVIGDNSAAWEIPHPKNFYVRLQKAQQLLNQKQWAEAVPILQELAESYRGEKGGDNPLWLLAVAHRQLEQTDAERSALEKLAKQEADFVDAFVRLLELAQARKDWPAVADYAQRILAVNPLLAQPYQALAQASEATDHKDQSIHAYRKLLLLSPPDAAGVHFSLARLLHERGDAETEARKHVLLALEDAPRYREAHKLLLKLKPTVDPVAVPVAAPTTDTPAPK